MEENKEFMQNLGMMIPLATFAPPKAKSISKRKKLVCILLGHKWGFAGISYMGPSFPRKCSRCKRTKWFDKPNLRMRLNKWVDKSLDIFWVPLCKLNIHRWKSHYGYSFYSYSPSESTPEVRQHVYKCSCCKKTKTVTI